MQMDLEFFEKNLMMHYQPIVDIHQGCISGFESLVRFKDCSVWHKKISTKKLIDSISSHKAAYIFDFFVIKTVYQDVLTRNNANFIFSINLHASTLANKNFINDLSVIMSSYPNSYNCIAFEITEKSLLSKEAEIKTLPKLKGLGFRLYIDDFITGYANFGALISPDIDMIKIDKSITDEVLSNLIVGKFASGITSLIHQLQKKVLFEGIETEAQLSYLKKIGCDFIQGFFISHALEIESALTFATTYNNMVDYHEGTI